MARDLLELAITSSSLRAARRSSRLSRPSLQAHGVEVIVHAADLRLRGRHRADQSEISHRTISICINSAGIASFGPFMEQDWNYEVKPVQFKRHGCVPADQGRAGSDGSARARARSVTRLRRGQHPDPQQRHVRVHQGWRECVYRGTPLRAEEEGHPRHLVGAGPCPGS